MQEIKSVNEEFVPKPYAFGQLRSANSPTYFFLCEFVDITNSLPDPKALGRRLADFHRKSESPTGMFGFEKTTYDGKLPQKTDWNPSWPDFFADLLLVSHSAFDHRRSENVTKTWRERLTDNIRCSI